MADDLFNATGDVLPEADAGASLPDVAGDADAGDSDDGYVADLTEAFERHAEGEPDTASDDPRDDLKREFEAHRETEAKVAAEADWGSRFDAMYRETIAAHGLTAEQAAQMGISRETAVERLFTAERILKQSPAHGMAWLARTYGAQLDPVQRAEMAASVLQSLGFQHGSELGQAERRELEEARQSFRQIRQHVAAHQQAQQQQLAHVEQVAAQHISEFSRGAKHFPAVRVTMGALIQSGAAHDLPTAYRMACASHGLTSEGAAAAQAQQQNIAKARAARTPRTSSYGAAAVAEDDGETSQKELLRAALAAQRSNGSSRRV